MAVQLAGDLAYAGAISTAIMEWARNGGGNPGWQAARQVLQERFPTSTQQARNSIIEHARDTIATGASYQRAGDGYTPGIRSLPDVRAIERYAGIVPPGGLSGADARVVFSTIQISIVDPARPNRLVQVTSHIEESNSPLSKGELMAIGNDIARSYLQQFQQYDPTALSPQGFEARVTIRGAYIGY